jgi:hypothetical protein
MTFHGERRKTADRRGSPRAAAAGRVRISFENPAPVEVEADWIESSATGFRLAHDSNLLEPGLEVSYQGAGRRGHARVVWTHVAEGRRVSGFIVI